MWYDDGVPACPPALKTALTNRACADVLARAQLKRRSKVTVGAEDPTCSEALQTAFESIKKNKIPKQGCAVSGLAPLAADGVSKRGLFDCNLKALRSSTQHPEQRFAMECIGYDWVTSRIVLYVIIGVFGGLAVCLLLCAIVCVWLDDQRRRKRKHAHRPVADEQPLPECAVTHMKLAAPPSIAVTHDAYAKMLPGA